MINDTKQWSPVWDLLDQEIAFYEALLLVMEREWECLKKADASSLLPLLREKEDHISQIKSLRESTQKGLAELAADGMEGRDSRSLPDLIQHLPTPQAQKMKNYLKTIHRLRDQILKANEQNKNFIQETLNFLNDLFNLLMSQSQEDPVYLKDGRKMLPEPLPSWMSRRI